MIEQNTLLRHDAIRLGLSAAGRWDAIEQTGRILTDIAATTPEYTADMRAREQRASTYIGREVAIPHGTGNAHNHINRSAIVVLQFPDPIDWDDQPVRLCLGIAATGDEQVGLLCSLAQILMNSDSTAQLHAAADPGSVLRLLSRAL
jgi:PTS system mannitol-specific IIA component